MKRKLPGVSALERVEALLANPALFELAELVPDASHRAGGRRRDYPAFMWLLYEALISVYGSARRVEAELAHPLVWRLIRSTVRRSYPDRPELQLGDRPMRRHHYLYARNRYLTDRTVLEALAGAHRRIAADQARQLGLLDPDGLGSWTHPDLSRMLHADGKVIAPLFKAEPGDRRLDRATGELRATRVEPDAALHFEGDGTAAWGTKFVLVAARTDDVHGRMILDIEWVPSPGGEARSAVDCFTRLAPHIPGAQGVIYDTALRGVHHQHLLRELGLLPINRVTAAKASPRKARRNDRRVEKSLHLEDKTISLADGSQRTLRLYAEGGALGVVELTDTGEPHFERLARVRTRRNSDKNGRYRWYNDYQLPARFGDQTITVRLHGNDEDAARKLNRTENLRPIPPGDPDFERLFPRRNDAESINRHLDDTMWLGRAHSIGHSRQHLNLHRLRPDGQLTRLAPPPTRTSDGARRVDRAGIAERVEPPRAKRVLDRRWAARSGGTGTQTGAAAAFPFYPGQSGTRVFDRESRRPRPRPPSGR
jgi:hypothetical protein